MEKFNTLGKILSFGAEKFEQADLHFGHGTDNPWDEMVLLALHVLNLPPEIDQEAENQVLSLDQKEQLLKLIDQRIELRIPAAYLTHTAYLNNLKFYVNPSVMIPRSPIAQLIEDQFLPFLKTPPKQILDLCTGSACLAVLCAKAFPQAQIDAVDISKPALEVAHKNIEHHACTQAIQLIQSNLFSQLPPKPYDLILSNPPYVQQSEYDTLPKEYFHEPEIAFLSDDFGLKITEQILKQAPNYLTPEGLLVVEVGSAKTDLCKRYPKLPFLWPDFQRGGEGVFLLQAEELKL